MGTVDSIILGLLKKSGIKMGGGILSNIQCWYFYAVFTVVVEKGKSDRPHQECTNRAILVSTVLETLQPL